MLKTGRQSIRRGAKRTAQLSTKPLSHRFASNGPLNQFPVAVQEFVNRQRTTPIGELCGSESETRPSPYGSYWYRAVACMLLSGRVKAKLDGQPNLTDVERICKEANFNPRLFVSVGSFYVAAGVVQANPAAGFEPGPNFTSFWSHDPQTLPSITHGAVLRLAADGTGLKEWRPTDPYSSKLIEFLTLFFAAFDGRAIPEDELGSCLHAFSTLPEDDLLRAAHMLRLPIWDYEICSWQDWLDEKGQRALIDAVYVAVWAYYAERDKERWIFPSAAGLAMLGLAEIPPPPQLAMDLKALPNLSIFAGAGLDSNRLVPLFRHCVIKRIDQIFEFQVDRRRLAESPAKVAADDELRAVLRDLEPLPAALADVLQTRSKLGGELRVRACNALVEPVTPEMLSAIQQHPRLKTYLAPGAPPGYLLVKATSSLDNFLQRCHELGFEIKFTCS